MKSKKWVKDWLPRWPTQPNQYRLKKFYQLYYLMFESEYMPYMMQIKILEAVKEGHIVVWGSINANQNSRSKE